MESTLVRSLHTRIQVLPFEHEIPILVLSLLAVIWVVRSAYLRRSDLPAVNKPSFWSFNRKPYVVKFATATDALLREGFRKGRKFILYTDAEPHLVLGHEYSEEVKAHPDLSFRAYTRTINISSTPGLEPFHEGANEDGLGPEVVTAKLNRQLGIVTSPLSDKAREGLSELWGDRFEWHTVSVRETIAHLVAKLSTRVFLGARLADDRALEAIIVNYTHVGIQAIMGLKKYPAIVRPFIQWYLPELRSARAMVKQTRALLRPEQDRREEERRACAASGTAPPKYPDTLTWANEVAKRNYDPVALQLGLSLAAVHTTADLMGQAVINLCHYPQWVPALREEVASVIGTHGMNKNSITKLVLLDSYLKESQRLKPIQRIFLQRQATKNVTLKDGTRIPAGQMLAIPTLRMTDPELYSNPEDFDPERFMKIRATPGKEQSAHLVSCTPDHIGFGLGRYACPGRFFAAHEIKIAMAHILLKYDVKFADPNEAALPLSYGITVFASPTAQIQVKRRKPEIDIDSIME